jgi:thiamine kinase-like enzyme
MRHEAILERLWPGRTIVSRPLGGGITNHNFLLEAEGGPLVLRIGGKDTEALGIDRRTEIAAARMAAGIGVGPEVVTVVEPEGYLVTRFIQGEPIPPERMRTRELIERLAPRLRLIHEADPIPGRFNPHRVVEAYATTAATRGVEVPNDYAWAKEIADAIERTRGPQAEVPCHNDLLNANFILSDEHVWIVDWEYAGMGDRLFDLGNLSVKHDFALDHDEALVRAYFGWVDRRVVSSIRLMRFMGAFFEAMWGVVQQGISELEFDFAGYARENFERLRSIAADARFGGWLEAAAPRAESDAVARRGRTSGR